MDKKISFGAEMTLQQFLALDNYLKSYDTIKEVLNTKEFHNLKLEGGVDVIDIKKNIFNGWNTERILRANNELLNNKDNYFVLQWSFPQAYYSVYMFTLSYLYLIGLTNTAPSHSGIMRKFGKLVKSDKYPKMISFYIEGSKKNLGFKNITKQYSMNSIEFNQNSIDSCQTKICQFLKATRQIDLVQRRNHYKTARVYKTKKGQRKTNLNQREWEEISKQMGVTNILHLLYRKRIKSNYREIKSFMYEGIEASQIHKNLVGIVNELNLIHECYIYKLIGRNKFLDFYKEYSNMKKISFLDKRIEMIKNGI